MVRAWAIDPQGAKLVHVGSLARVGSTIAASPGRAQVRSGRQAPERQSACAVHDDPVLSTPWQAARRSVRMANAAPGITGTSSCGVGGHCFR